MCVGPDKVIYVLSFYIWIVASYFVWTSATNKTVCLEGVRRQPIPLKPHFNWSAFVTCHTSQLNDSIAENAIKENEAKFTPTACMVLHSFVIFAFSILFFIFFCIEKRLWKIDCVQLIDVMRECTRCTRPTNNRKRNSNTQYTNLCGSKLKVKRLVNK